MIFMIKLRYAIIAYLIILSITFIIWKFTTEKATISKHIHFFTVGPIYFLFFKIGLIIFDVAGLIYLFHWEEFNNSPKKHFLILIFLWILFFFLIVLDPRRW